MEHYSNNGGDSGISNYQIEDTRIIVWFKGGKAYSYSYSRAGQTHVENMKRLALGGTGLNEYINKYVKYLYD